MTFFYYCLVINLKALSLSQGSMTFVGARPTIYDVFRLFTCLGLSILTTSANATYLPGICIDPAYVTTFSFCGAQGK